MEIKHARLTKTELWTIVRIFFFGLKKFKERLITFIVLIVILKKVFVTTCELTKSGREQREIYPAQYEKKRKKNRVSVNFKEQQWLNI